MFRHKRSIKLLFVYLFFFICGFVIHALFFPYLLTDNIQFILSPKTEGKSNILTEPIINKTVSRVVFDRGEFSPRVVQVRKSYYISIVNISDKELMWLTSKNPLFQTSRGYGKSEELFTILYDAGIWEVYDKNHPNSKLKVIVK